MAREADLRYEPKAKEMVNAICIPDDPRLFITIIDNYIEEDTETTSGGDTERSVLQEMRAGE